MGPLAQGRAAQNYAAMAGYPSERYASMGATGIFLEDLVRDTIAQVFRIKLPATRFASGELVTILSGARGAQALRWIELGQSGNDAESGIVPETSKDIRSVTLSSAQHLQGIETVMRSFEYTIQDLDTAAMQGLWNLVTEKANAVRRQLDLDFDSYIADGVPKVGWPSIFAIPGRLKVKKVNGAWTNSATTYDKFQGDISAALAAQFSATNGIEQPDTVLFAKNLWFALKRPAFPTYSADPMLEVLQEAFPEIPNWTWERHLPDGAMFLYRNSPDAVAAFAPVRFEFLPPQAEAAMFKTIVRNRFGGCFSPYPASMIYMDGLT
jgi:hypothetical protein